MNWLEQADVLVVHAVVGLGEHMVEVGVEVVREFEGEPVASVAVAFAAVVAERYAHDGHSGLLGILDD
jgi:hypothetical protein